MKKLDELNRLVEEALKDVQNTGHISWKDILTTLARKCAEINVPDLVIECNERYDRYNSRLREGQVEEVKQEEKPALQPLPEEMPAFVHDMFVDLLHNRLQPSAFYSAIRNTYGTPREWWQNLKKGDKFVYKKDVCTFDGRVAIGDVDYRTFNLEDCSPYTDPAQSFRDKLTPEMQVEFDKVVSSLTPNTTQS